MKSYFLSVICAAFLCAIASGLGNQEGINKKLLKSVCGVFLSFMIVRPLPTAKIDLLSFNDMEFAKDAAAFSRQGEQNLAEAMDAIIKQETQAYILDKARRLEATITVEVGTNEEQIPVSVVLSGNISPEGRRALSEIIESDLGIAKENQFWNVS